MNDWFWGMAFSLPAGILIGVAGCLIHSIYRERQSEPGEGHPDADWGGNLTPEQDLQRIREGYAAAADTEIGEPSVLVLPAPGRHRADDPARAVRRIHIKTGTQEIPIVPANQGPRRSYTRRETPGRRIREHV